MQSTLLKIGIKNMPIFFKPSPPMEGIRLTTMVKMFNGAQRLEKRQMGRYGDNEEYNNYANKTPIIIPLLPIYHLNKKK